MSAAVRGAGSPRNAESRGDAQLQKTEFKTKTMPERVTEAGGFTELYDKNFATQKKSIKFTLCLFLTTLM